MARQKMTMSEDLLFVRVIVRKIEGFVLRDGVRMQTVAAPDVTNRINVAGTTLNHIQYYSINGHGALMLDTVH